MLVMGLLQAVLGFMTWLVSMLPSAATFDVSWLHSAQRWIGVSMMLDSYLPITEILSALTIYGVVYVAADTGGILRKMWSMISGGGGA